jgi:hypothetical protein
MRHLVAVLLLIAVPASGKLPLPPSRAPSQSETEWDDLQRAWTICQKRWHEGKMYATYEVGWEACVIVDLKRQIGMLDPHRLDHVEKTEELMLVDRVAGIGEGYVIIRESP